MVARVLVAACQAVGFNDRDAELIRLGENAQFRLADVPVIVRVARGREWLPTAQKEGAVARWLEGKGVSAAHRGRRRATPGDPRVPGYVLAPDRAR